MGAVAKALVELVLSGERWTCGHAAPGPGRCCRVWRDLALRPFMGTLRRVRTERAWSSHWFAGTSESTS